MEKKAEGPDRGWSWVVAFAACLNSLILAGIFRTSGVLFVAFIKEFRVSREEASWPVILCISVLNLTGIVTGPLAQKFGIRPVALVGSIIAAAGVSSCYFATSLTSITILFGVVFGVGYGLTATLMPVVVNEYFLKHRATANGIANSGSCFGSIMFPPLFEFFIENYDLSGCFLLTGGIVLNVALTAAVMRPAPWMKRTTIVKSKVSASTNDAAGLPPPDGFDAAGSKTSGHSKLYDAADGTAPSSGRLDCYDAVIRSLERRNSVLKTTDRNSIGRNKESYVKIDDQLELTERNPEDRKNRTFTDEIERSVIDLEESLLTFEEVYKDSVNSPCKYGSFENSDEPKDHLQSIMTYNDFTKNNSDIGFIPKESHDLTSNADSKCLEMSSENINSLNVSFNSKSSILKSDENVDTNDKESVQGILRSFRRVLTCPMFYVTVGNNIIFYTLYHVFVVIIIDYSLDKGIPDKDTKYILFGFATADLLGRLGLGWITDRKLLRSHHYVMLCMILIGLTFFIFPFANSLNWLVGASSLYGLLLGCTMIMFPILLVDFLGVEVNAVAMGCMCFLNGVSSFVRPFLIGYFRDNLGSYSDIFYVLGGTSFATAFLWLLENCFKKNSSPRTDKGPLKSV